MAEKSASQQIDDIIQKADDWRGNMLAQLRSIILESDRDVIEEVKWKKPSKPEGVAVWSYEGNLCMADILKNAVRLNFPKGAQIKDPDKLFNTRLDGRTIRAIDFLEGEKINKAALKDSSKRLWQRTKPEKVSLFGDSIDEATAPKSKGRW